MSGTLRTSGATRGGLKHLSKVDIIGAKPLEAHEIAVQGIPGIRDDAGELALGATMIKCTFEAFTPNALAARISGALCKNQSARGQAEACMLSSLSQSESSSCSKRC